jgi:hypothetical protein
LSCVPSIAAEKRQALRFAAVSLVGLGRQPFHQTMFCELEPAIRAKANNHDITHPVGRTLHLTTPSYT